MKMQFNEQSNKNSIALESEDILGMDSFGTINLSN